MNALAAQQARFMDALCAPGAPAQAQLAIYHGASRANWLKALAAAYPVVQRLVGESFFVALCDDYLRRFPSRSGDLNQLGGWLHQFIEGYPPAAALGYLAEVARLEWALHEAGHAGDAPRFDFASLATVPAERHGDIELQLAPWARLLRSSHPIVAIWEANQPGRDGSLEPATGDEDRVLVLREDYVPRPTRLSLPEWTVLGAIARGERLAGVVASLGDDAALLGEVLARQAATGAICGFRLFA